MKCSQHVLKTYITNNPITEEQFLDSVAYMVDGKITDTLFDAFVFTPTPNYMYSYDNCVGVKRPYTKQDWLSFIHNETFLSGKNMDALEKAVASLKSALGLKEYKVKVFLSLLYPNQVVTDFGEVNGKNLNFSNEDDRFEAIKWLIKEQLSVFESRNYQNIEVEGFFWFTEEVECEEDAILIRKITDYLHETKYASMWSPYFNCRGFDGGRILPSLNFDRVTMQANYYPASKTIPNNGDIARLQKNADNTRNFGIGFEMEIGGNQPASVKGFKEYMYAGLQFGFAQGYHVWYLSGGPNQVSSLCRFDECYQRSAYDEMYRYIKGKLKLSDIMLDF